MFIYNGDSLLSRLVLVIACHFIVEYCFHVLYNGYGK